MVAANNCARLLCAYYSLMMSKIFLVFIGFGAGDDGEEKTGAGNGGTGQWMG